MFFLTGDGFSWSWYRKRIVFLANWIKGSYWIRTRINNKDKFLDSVIDCVSRCEWCGADITEMDNTPYFHVERSGIQPGTPDDPAVYWSEGILTCYNCGHKMEHCVST